MYSLSQSCLAYLRDVKPYGFERDNHRDPTILGTVIYRPPEFDLIHFADEAILMPGRARVRWVSDWRGDSGGPAEQVTLGWALHQSRIVVATSTVAHLPDKHDRRENSVLQAFAGSQLGVIPIMSRQVSAAIVHARRVPDFEPFELVADDTVCTGAASLVHGVLVGHARVGTRVAIFAARGLTLDQIRLQTLDGPDEYPIDPMSSHKARDLSRQLPAFGRLR